MDCKRSCCPQAARQYDQDDLIKVRSFVLLIISQLFVRIIRMFSFHCTHTLRFSFSLTVVWSEALDMIGVTCSSVFVLSDSESQPFQIVKLLVLYIYK